MAAAVRVIVNADFRRQIAAFRSSGLLIDDTTMRTLVTTAALSAQKLARTNLKEKVYTAQLPKSAYHSYPQDPERYLEKRRTGQIFNAVKIDPPYREGTNWVGTVKVSRDDIQGFYYALILNFGGKTIKYDARPFWTDMVRVMVVRFNALGAATLRDMKATVLEGEAGSLSAAGTITIFDGSSGASSSSGGA